MYFENLYKIPEVTLTHPSPRSDLEVRFAIVSWAFAFKESMPLYLQPINDGNGIDKVKLFGRRAAAPYHGRTFDTDRLFLSVAIFRGYHRGYQL